MAKGQLDVIDCQPVEVDQAERLAAFAAANKTLGTGNPRTARFGAPAAGGGIPLGTAPAMEETIRGDDHAVERTVRRERHDLAAHWLQSRVALVVGGEARLGLTADGARAAAEEKVEDVRHRLPGMGEDDAIDPPDGMPNELAGDIDGAEREQDGVQEQRSSDQEPERFGERLGEVGFP